jgi:hypothetical protein
MRRLFPRLLLPFALLAGLASCEMALPKLGGDTPAATTQGGPITGDPIEVTTLDAPPAPPGTAAGAPAPADTAEEAPPEEVEPAAPPSPEAAACIRKGGSWSKAGASGAMTCVKPTRDGGKQCRRDSDCEGLCLARSGTCAPITPLFGCHEVLEDDGRRMTLCID